MATPGRVVRNGRNGVQGKKTLDTPADRAWLLCRTHTRLNGSGGTTESPYATWMGSQRSWAANFSRSAGP